MARIAGVSAKTAGPIVKIAYYFSRRQMGKLTGRQPERMIEPVEVFAYLPKLLMAYGRLEQATAKLDKLDERIGILAELKAATLTNCEYCIDIGSQIARRSGLTDAELLALPTYRTSPLFSELDKLVLDYAVGMSRTPVDVPDELFDRLRTGEHARPVQPGHGHRLGRVHRGHGVRGTRATGVVTAAACCPPWPDVPMPRPRSPAC
jgi:4-carboxymuconolactone decarboxylase